MARALVSGLTARRHGGAARLALLTAVAAGGTVLIAACAETLLTNFGRGATSVAAATGSLAWAVGLLRASERGRRGRVIRRR